MEPIPETTEAMAELDPLVYDDDLIEQLIAVGARVREIAPDCIGMSLTTLREGVTFTLVASSAEVAELDAVQYLSDGPCLRAVAEDQVVATDHATMDEKSWHLFGEATAAHGVASTLSMPVLHASEVVGGVNLYGASREAFDGHHEALAEAVGGWAEGAVTNADLSFSTRLSAERAPEVLRDAVAVESAVGMLAGLLRIATDEAHARLRLAAGRSGTPESGLARMLVEILRD